MNAIVSGPADQIRDITYRSADGLLLAAREFVGPPHPAGAVLCLHGLTRNGRDFDETARRLSAEWRVIAPDQRGRGRSEYDPTPANYNPMTQTADMWTLLDTLGVDRVVIIGTSMGALMGVLMANQNPGRIAGLVLNDAGPEVDPKGLARIKAYVGNTTTYPDWDTATTALAGVHGPAYPTYSREDWERLARATFVLEGEGLRLDYDPALKAALAAASAPPDMWPLFEPLKSIPTLVLRGQLSDLLSQATADQMVARLGATLITVPDRGHAPDLSEPSVTPALDAFLAQPQLRQRLGDTDKT